MVGNDKASKLLAHVSWTAAPARMLGLPEDAHVKAASTQKDEVADQVASFRLSLCLELPLNRLESVLWKAFRVRRLVLQCLNKYVQ